jgi:hypothetical protein
MLKSGKNIIIRRYLLQSEEDAKNEKQYAYDQDAVFDQGQSQNAFTEQDTTKDEEHSNDEDDICRNIAVSLCLINIIFH